MTDQNRKQWWLEEMRMDRRRRRWQNSSWGRSSLTPPPPLLPISDRLSETSPIENNSKGSIKISSSIDLQGIDNLDRIRELMSHEKLDERK